MKIICLKTHRKAEWFDGSLNKVVVQPKEIPEVTQKISCPPKDTTCPKIPSGSDNIVNNGYFHCFLQEGVVGAIEDKYSAGSKCVFKCIKDNKPTRYMVQCSGCYSAENRQFFWQKPEKPGTAVIYKEMVRDTKGLCEGGGGGSTGNSTCQSFDTNAVNGKWTCKLNDKVESPNGGRYPVMTICDLECETTKKKFWMYCQNETWFVLTKTEKNPQDSNIYTNKPVTDGKIKELNEKFCTEEKYMCKDFERMANGGAWHCQNKEGEIVTGGLSSLGTNCEFKCHGQRKTLKRIKCYHSSQDQEMEVIDWTNSDTNHVVTVNDIMELTIDLCPIIKCSDFDLDKTKEGWWHCIYPLPLQWRIWDNFVAGSQCRFKCYVEGKFEIEVICQNDEQWHQEDNRRIIHSTDNLEQIATTACTGGIITSTPTPTPSTTPPDTLSYCEPFQTRYELGYWRCEQGDETPIFDNLKYPKGAICEFVCYNEVENVLDTLICKGGRKNTAYWWLKSNGERMDKLQIYIRSKMLEKLCDGGKPCSDHETCFKFSKWNEFGQWICIGKDGKPIEDDCYYPGSSCYFKCHGIDHIGDMNIQCHEDKKWHDRDDHRVLEKDDIEKY